MVIYIGALKRKGKGVLTGALEIPDKKTFSQIALSFLIQKPPASEEMKDKNASFNPFPLDAFNQIIPLVVGFYKIQNPFSTPF